MQLYETANKLRGNLTASEYLNVVLGLVFLKYISDCFEKRYNELVAEGGGFEENSDEYMPSCIVRTIVDVLQPFEEKMARH